MVVEIRRMVAQGVRGLYAARSNSGWATGLVCIVLLFFLWESCARPAVNEPVTLTLLEEWTNNKFSEGNYLQYHL